MTVIYSQTTSSSNMFNIESANVACGMCIKSGDSLLGQSINQCEFSLSKVGTPTATTLYCRVYNTSTGLTVKHTFGEMATADLTTDTTVYTFKGNSYTLVANDVIAIYADNSGASYPNNMILQGGRSGYSTATLKFGDYGGSWSSTGNQLPYIILSLLTTIPLTPPIAMVNL